MGSGTWRKRLSPLIEEIRIKFVGATEAQLHLLFFKAYPFLRPSQNGPVEPYRVWRDEILVQLGEKEPPKEEGQDDEPSRCAHTLDMFG